MAVQPVGPEDAVLLCATDPAAQLQIGALCFFEGAPLRDGDGRLRLHDLRRQVEARLHGSPRFRQRIAPVPLDAARPVWVDDEDFDITRHVHPAVLPAPGGPDQLRAFVDRLLSRPLDPSKPLWELWVVDGVEDGRVAVVLRVHHAMADGLSLLEAALLMLDPERDAAQATAAPWRPHRPPGPVRLLWDSLADRRRHQLRLAGDAVRAAVDPRWIVGAARAAVGTAVSPPATAPSLALNGRVGARRDFVWASLPLRRLVAVARARGVTLNDVVLTVVTDALRHHLGPEVAAGFGRRPPRALVPVGATAAAGSGGNAFSFVVTPLPVACGDPLEVLDRIHRDMVERKASAQSAATSSLFSIVDVVPLPVLRALGPQALARQPFVNLAVTNIPGSRDPVYLMGARMEELHPIVTGVGNIACIIGVLSYRHHLGVGITVDPDVVADPDGLLAEVVAAADRLATV